MTGTPTPAPPGATDAAEDEASYGTRVEDAFISERGTPFLLAPKDWLLIRGWREAGVPADTVIRAIRGAFEKKRARGDLSKISSLSYCANAVEVLWEMERRGLVGSHAARRSADGEAFDAGPRLRWLVEALGGVEGPFPGGVDAADVAGALRDAGVAVGALDPSAGLEPLEEALAKAEKALLKKLEKALGDEARERLAVEVESQAGDVSKLPRETQRRIHSALRGRALRRIFNVPPLTLLGE